MPLRCRLQAGATYRFAPESFDRIMLDPSCSALGLRPRLLHDRTSVAELQGYAKLQRILLRWAVKLLKPGGTLVFSTCTFNPLENEANVAFALRTFPLQLVPQGRFHLGGPGLPVRVHIIVKNARIRHVCQYQSCMVSK